MNARAAIEVDRVEVAPLPPEYTSFVDRRELLAMAREALGGARLLTITGPGGVGKTRFAVRLTRSVRGLYPDGAWFVDLTRVSPTGSVVTELSGALRVPMADQDGLGPVIAFFSAKRGILVLDNCEHVIGECAAVVRTLVESCPALTVIATSREPLRIRAERVLRVDPFETSGEDGGGGAAAALFLERCANMLSEPTAADRAAIDAICRGLDGLPLAIELAATRVRVLAPPQLLDRLSEPLAFLVGGVRDAPARQRTIRATIQWSYELCTEREQLLWRRMSVFVGGWDLDAAEWMLGPSTDEDEAESALDVVHSLLEKSIVIRRTRGSETYYDMLDTLRAFGSELSSQQEIAESRARHVDWYVGRVETIADEWYGPEQAKWLAYLRGELPNIRAALEFSIGAGDADSASRLIVTVFRPMWMANGLFVEATRWSDRLLELDAEATHALCVVMAIRGCAAVLGGDDGGGARLIERARSLAEELRDPASAYAVEELRTAVVQPPEEQIRQTLQLLDEHGTEYQRYARTNTPNRLALAYELVGDVDDAAALRAEIIRRGEDAGESYESSELLFVSAMAKLRRGDAKQAEPLLRQALRLAENLERPQVDRVIEALARAAADQRDFTRAGTLLGISYPRGDAVGAIAASDPRWGAVRTSTEATTLKHLGRRAYEAAIAAGRALAPADGIAYALGVRQAPPVRATAAPEGILTRREAEVAALVRQGLTDREIAARLVISKRTAEGHVSNALAKLGFSSRSELAVWSSSRAGGDA